MSNHNLVILEKDPTLCNICKALVSAVEDNVSDPTNEQAVRNLNLKQ